MIIRAPLSKCPDCHYLLRGLPTAGRCPECGFHYDEHTIVMRPVKFWRKFLVTVGIEILLLYHLSPILFVLLGKFLPGQYAIATLLALVLGVLAATARYLFRVTKHDHFAALTPKGVVVKNRTGEHRVAVEDISLFSKDDPIPWIKERGIDHTISLANLFDARSELAEFKQAVFGTAPKNPPPSQADRNAGNQEDSQRRDAQPDQQEAGSRSRRNKQRRPKSVATTIGVSLIATGILSMPISALLPPNGIKETISSIGVGMFWLGAAIALIGQWTSDPISRKQKKQE